MDKLEIESIAVKLYHRKKNGWNIVGYKCPYCYKHYQTLRKEALEHINSCDGPKERRTLED